MFPISEQSISPRWYNGSRCVFGVKGTELSLVDVCRFNADILLVSTVPFYAGHTVVTSDNFEEYLNIDFGFSRCRPTTLLR